MYRQMIEIKENTKEKVVSVRQYNVTRCNACLASLARFLFHITTASSSSTTTIRSSKEQHQSNFSAT